MSTASFPRAQRQPPTVGATELAYVAELANDSFARSGCPYVAGKVFLAIATPVATKAAIPAQNTPPAAKLRLAL